VTDADDPLEAAWRRAEEAWDDDEVHRKFVALCVALGRLEVAGRRYRTIRDTDPARRAVAEQRIEWVIAQAMATLELTKTDPDPRPRRRLFWVALLVAATLVGAALWVWLDAQR